MMDKFLMYFYKLDCPEEGENKSSKLSTKRTKWIRIFTNWLQNSAQRHSCFWWSLHDWKGMGIWNFARTSLVGHWLKNKINSWDLILRNPCYKMTSTPSCGLLRKFIQKFKSKNDYFDFDEHHTIWTVFFTFSRKLFFLLKTIISFSSFLEFLHLPEISWITNWNEKSPALMENVWSTSWELEWSLVGSQWEAGWAWVSKIKRSTSQCLLEKSNIYFPFYKICKNYIF
jgi:hypothetical protein